MLQSLRPEDIVSIVIAFFSLVGVCFTAYCTLKVKKSTNEINDAVNHRGPDGLRLYEMVMLHGDCLIKLDTRMDRIEARLLEDDQKKIEKISKEVHIL